MQRDRPNHLDSVRPTPGGVDQRRRPRRFGVAACWLFGGAWLAACWTPASMPSSTASPAPAPAPAALRVAGDWEQAQVAPNAMLGGIAASSRGPLLYLGIGDEATVRSLAHPDGPRWRATLPGIVVGAIAADGEQLALTVIDDDDVTPADLAGHATSGDPLDAMLADIAWQKLRYFDPVTRQVEDVRLGCIGHVVLFEAGRPVIVAGCEDRVAVLDRTRGGWLERGSIPGIGYPIGAAVDREGRLHVIDRQDEHLRNLGRDVDRPEVRHWSLGRDGTLEHHELPRQVRLEAMGACGGRIHATFTRRTATGSLLLMGTWERDRWHLEQVDKTSGSAWSVLGFDEACRVFAASDRTIWSRGSSGWQSTTWPEPPARSIVAVAAHAGRLHVVFVESRTTLGLTSSSLAAE